MRRLIDIDKIKPIDFPSTEMDGLDVVLYLNTLPAVDAVEVVHGEWVVCGDGEYVPFMCSACGKTTSWYHAQTANYCPNCGAKMYGGSDG